jgi:hypothetical protein
MVQESKHTAWRLANMNLPICGIDNNLRAEHADSLKRFKLGGLRDALLPTLIAVEFLAPDPERMVEAAL